MDINQLKENIKNAFKDHPKPSEEKIVITDFQKYYPADIEYVAQQSNDESLKFKEKLNYRNFNDIDHFFIKDNYFSFTAYLTPEALAYYLPAILIDFLNKSTDGRNADFFKIMTILSPGYSFLYYSGKDSSFDEFLSYLNDREYDVICQFLELINQTDIAHINFHIALTARFGFNKKENSLTRKSKEYFDQYYPYTYPKLEDPELNQLAEKIYSVFSQTPMPDENKLIDSKQSDEEAEYALIFRGLLWHKIHPEFINFKTGALNFFTDETLRYYLPAFMLASLHGFLDAIPDFTLTHGFYPGSDNQDPQGPIAIDWKDLNSKRMAIFNREERKIIIEYLQYLAAREDLFDTNHIKQALENYWLAS